LIAARSKLAVPVTRKSEADCWPAGGRLSAAHARRRGTRRRRVEARLTGGVQPQPARRVDWGW